MRIAGTIPVQAIAMGDSDPGWPDTTDAPYLLGKGASGGMMV